MCSAREWGIFFCARRENVAACAGLGCPVRAEGPVVSFCVEMVGVGDGVMGDFVYIYGVIF